VEIYQLKPVRPQYQRPRENTQTRSAHTPKCKLAQCSSLQTNKTVHTQNTTACSTAFHFQREEHETLNTGIKTDPFNPHLPVCLTQHIQHVLQHPHQRISANSRTPIVTQYC
jgi:hypothetical protein